ncbi:MAG: hypothetical protein K0S74_1106 [Chlamydiales bacterium]|jgi:hypothetical protein|nr:hypothetical protein [Chlamydiales bacterium]
MISQTFPKLVYTSFNTQDEELGYEAAYKDATFDDQLLSETPSDMPYIINLRRIAAADHTKDFENKPSAAAKYIEILQEIFDKALDSNLKNYSEDKLSRICNDRKISPSSFQYSDKDKSWCCYIEVQQYSQARINQYFLEALKQHGLKKDLFLNLYFHYWNALTSEEVEPIAELIRRNRLHTLNFYRASIESSAINKLAEALKENSSCKTIEIFTGSSPDIRHLSAEDIHTLDSLREKRIDLKINIQQILVRLKKQKN